MPYAKAGRRSSSKAASRDPSQDFAVCKDLASTGTSAWFLCVGDFATSAQPNLGEVAERHLEQMLVSGLATDLCDEPALFLETLAASLNNRLWSIKTPGADAPARCTVVLALVRLGRCHWLAVGDAGIAFACSGRLILPHGSDWASAPVTSGDPNDRRLLLARTPTFLGERFLDQPPGPTRSFGLDRVDCLLLFSDGADSVPPARRLEFIEAGGGDPEKIADSIVKAASDEDDVTVIAATSPFPPANPDAVDVRKQLLESVRSLEERQGHELAKLRTYMVQLRELRENFATREDLNRLVGRGTDVDRLRSEFVAELAKARRDLLDHLNTALIKTDEQFNRRLEMTTRSMATAVHVDKIVEAIRAVEVALHNIAGNQPAEIRQKPSIGSDSRAASEPDWPPRRDTSSARAESPEPKTVGAPAPSWHAAVYRSEVGARLPSPLVLGMAILVFLLTVGVAGYLVLSGRERGVPEPEAADDQQSALHLSTLDSLVEAGLLQVVIAVPQDDRFISCQNLASSAGISVDSLQFLNPELYRQGRCQILDRMTIYLPVERTGPDQDIEDAP